MAFMSTAPDEAASIPRLAVLEQMFDLLPARVDMVANFLTNDRLREPPRLDQFVIFAHAGGSAVGLVGADPVLSAFTPAPGMGFQLKTGFLSFTIPAGTTRIQQVVQNSDDGLFDSAALIDRHPPPCRSPPPCCLLDRPRRCEEPSPAGVSLAID